MFRTPYSTTICDLGTALSLSRMVTPPKSRLLELLDEAAKECRNERRNASSMDRFNDFADALDEIHKARALIVGGQS